MEHPPSAHKAKETESTNDLKKRGKERKTTELHRAVHDGNLNKLLSLLGMDKDGKITGVAQVTDVDQESPMGETPLHFAMYHGKEKMLEPLIMAGAKVNKASCSGWTPLIMGVMGHSPAASASVVQKFIQLCKAHNKSLKLTKSNAFGETALHFACTHGLLDTVKVLVDAGMDIDVRTATGETPLQLAEENEHKDIVKFLKEKGAKDIPPLPKPLAPELNAPDYIQQGFLKDEKLMKLEADFGGALWCDGIEVFYTGKKPKIGYCVEIAVNFKQMVSGKTFSWLPGIISDVSDDKKTLKATVRLNVDHAGVIHQLSGEWEATLTWYPFLGCPWVLTSLVPLKDETKSYDKMVLVAKEREATEGRKVANKAHNEENVCMVLKGTPNVENAKIITEVDLFLDTGTLVYTLDDGQKRTIQGEMVSFLFNQIMTQNAELRRSGTGAIIRINGQQLQSEDYEEDEEN